MKTLTSLVATIVAVAFAGCASLQREQKLPLAEIPPTVKAAAEHAIPGLLVVEAEVETKDGTTVYELEGAADGRKCEVEIQADGTILRIKKDDGED